MIPPGQSNASELWVLVEDLTSATDTKRNNACDKSHKNKYFVTLTVEDRLEGFKEQDYSISHNPCDKSNCQFYALSYLLWKIDIHRSARGVCLEVVNMSEHSGNSEGQPLKYFAGLRW